MKRLVAYLLTACFCLQTPLSSLTVQAANMQTMEVKPAYASTQTSSKASPSDASSSNAESDESTESDGLRGSVQVEITPVLALGKPMELNVTLESEQTRMGTVSETVHVLVDSVTQYVDFSKLPSGKYSLTITGEGYETYQQSITVEQSTSRVILINHYLDGYQFDSSSKHPGVIRLGDITGDGLIDENDKDQLLNAINTQSSDNRYDVNGDGEIDLIDLQYFSIFYNNRADSKAKVVRYATVLPEEVSLASSSNAVLKSGEISDLFNGKESHVSLEPKAGGVISGANPIEFTMEFSKDVPTEGFTVVPPVDSDNMIQSGTITVEYEENGVVKQEAIPLQSVRARSARSTSRSQTVVTKDHDGTIVLDLGKQVAIKKITFKITSTSSNKLADISKVEFLNKMEERIPAPVMDIPTNLVGIPGSEEFTVTWNPANNVTGYEVEITHEGAIEKISTSKNSLEVKKFKNKDIINGKPYMVRVQSTNADWRSGFGNTITVIPKADKRPDAPEQISIVAGYKELNVSWKKMKDTDRYTLFYRVAGAKDAPYQSVAGIEQNSYTLSDLMDETTYDIYLIGHNELGDSPASSVYQGKTASLNPPVTPNYKLINVPVEDSNKTAHIESVEYIKASGNQEVKSEFTVVDHDYSTSWIRRDWDSGAIYSPGKSPIVEFDQVYEMDTVVMIPDGQQKFNPYIAKVFYWNENGNRVEAPGRLTVKTSSNGRNYYEFQSNKPMKAKKIQINMANPSGTQGRISIAEMKFYYYDSVEKEINDLFLDNMHMELRSGVSQTDIDTLRARLNTKDSVSDEYHPKKNLLEKELETAEFILNDQAIGGILEIDPGVTKRKDGHITFGSGLNAWQPLGVTASAGDTIVVYVGYPNKKAGDNTELKLITTQYHAEVSSWFKTINQNLKVGRNEITIPKLTDLEVERGGQIYIEYTGNNANDQYAVRVSGGNRIPVLDITKASSSDAKQEMVREYVKELNTYVPSIKAEHEKLHHNGAEDPDYASGNKQNCILGATDIVMENMMYSVSAEQILAGLNGSEEEKANQLYNSLTAMEDMVNLFYQHKGLSNAAGAGSKNRLPSSRLNIRYHRMFAGAFMYAGGLHIGIEWGSVAGLSSGVPVESTPEGLYQSGEYFGWGIAHEIGHIINEGAYAVAEVTNNYFSILAQAEDTNDTTRFSYDDIYKKVTSQTIGRSSDVFTQLGLYWQLHLAYDKGGYNFKIFDDYQEQFNNLFFARVDTYARDTSVAPKPNGIALTLNGDSDNKLMRLSCAAAQKDILEFFERWGMVPDAATRQYASQFPKESRAIYLVNDEARVYEMQHGKDGSIAAATKVDANLSYTPNTNQVTIQLSNDASDPDAMLGYEIFRSETRKDQVIRKSVGFVTADQSTYTDTVSTINNRVFTYDVVGYDKYLNATEKKELEPIKVSHGGFISKEDFTVTTNLVSSADQEHGGEDSPCEPPKTAIRSIIDGDYSTTYEGSVSRGTPEIILNLNKNEAVTGLKYTAGNGTPIGRYKVDISKDGSTWVKVKEGTFNLQNKEETVYFNKEGDDWLYTYDASYVKISALNQAGAALSIAEFDILGPSGDNIEIYDVNGIGTLKADYNAGSGESGADVIIPKGSLIFTGTYKGNPAYNAVMLFDEKGQIVGGTDADGAISSSQMIFAKVPDRGDLGEISEGTWIYYIEPQYMQNEFKKPNKVRAELYRVDDANSNHGERLVSDTKLIQVPDQLPEIEIKSSSAGDGVQ